MLIKKYIPGTEGCLNLFVRPERTIFKCHGKWHVAKATKYIVQWEGYPSLDSGYAAHEFASLAEAKKYFDARKDY